MYPWNSRPKRFEKRSVSAWHPLNKNALKLMTTTSVFNCCFKTQPTIKIKNWNKQHIYTVDTCLQYNIIQCYHRGGIVINFRQIMCQLQKITLKDHTARSDCWVEFGLGVIFHNYINFDSYLNSTQTLKLFYNPRGGTQILPTLKFKEGKCGNCYAKSYRVYFFQPRFQSLTSRHTLSDEMHVHW